MKDNKNKKPATTPEKKPMQPNQPQKPGQNPATKKPEPGKRK